jgi:hypothetical protein
MRLLNTHTFELKDFFNEASLPDYAILSHTWGEDEIVFRDLQQKNDTWKSKASFNKISGFCSTAKDNGYQWGWADTLCIDKSSSAELSEAINSMFRYYARSHVCFVYLVDMRVNFSNPDSLGPFVNSRWHKRGWTLQELLAPGRVEFYDMDWIQFGTRLTLRGTLSSITNIRPEILRTSFDPKSSKMKYCVAEKMSWAASRITSRIEDAAYCLFGIFDINMPLLYGEGQRAFERLQLEILADTEDLTLFAWKHHDYAVHSSHFDPVQPKSQPRHFSCLDLLARTPWNFSLPINPERDLWTYQSLEPGPYNKSYDCLEALLEASSDTMGHFGALRTGSLMKRRGTLRHDFALLTTHHGRYYLILCKARPKDQPSWTHTGSEYLCLPVRYDDTSKQYHKVGGPCRINAKDWPPGNISYKSIVIPLRVTDLSRSSQSLVPAAVVLSLQRTQKSPKEHFVHQGHHWALFLRHRSSEFVVLVSISKNQGAEYDPPAWFIFLTWDDFPTPRDHYPMPGDEDDFPSVFDNLRSIGDDLPVPVRPASLLKEADHSDFVSCRLESGGLLSCSIKPRSKNWFHSQTQTLPSIREIQDADPDECNNFFDFSVTIQTTKGRSELVDHLGRCEFVAEHDLRTWLCSTNPREELMSRIVESERQREAQSPAQNRWFSMSP